MTRCEINAYTAFITINALCEHIQHLNKQVYIHKWSISCMCVTDINSLLYLRSVLFIRQIGTHAIRKCVEWHLQPKAALQHTKHAPKRVLFLLTCSFYSILIGSEARTYKTRFLPQISSYAHELIERG